jgi:hypothetical protein
MYFASWQCPYLSIKLHHIANYRDDKMFCLFRWLVVFNIGEEEIVC